MEFSVTSNTDTSLTVSTAAGENELNFIGEQNFSIPVGCLTDTMYITLNSDDPVYISNIRLVNNFDMRNFLRVLCICCVTVLVGWFSLKHKIHLVTFFAIIGICITIVLTKQIQMWHGWDEALHYNNIIGIFNANSFSEWLHNFSLWYIDYLPSVPGFLIGQICSLPFTVSYRLAMISQSLVYAFLCSLSVRKNPNYRMSFFCVSLFPTCVWQATCCTYDSMVIGASLFITSYALECVSKEKKLSNFEMLKLTVPSLLLLPKPAYSVIMLLYLLIPKEHFSNNRQKNVFRVFIVIFVIWSMVSVLLPAYSNVIGGDGRFEGANSKLQW